MTEGHPKPLKKDLNYQHFHTLYLTTAMYKCGIDSKTKK